MKKFLFYFLSFTWGIIMTLIGCFAFLGLIITGHKVRKFNERYYIQVGNHWGGVNLGCFFLTDNSPSLHTKQLESGHGIQNIILGPFMPFVVCIPSAIRYWLMEIKKQSSRYVFASIVSILIILIGVALIVPGFVFTLIPLIVIGDLISIYGITLFCWLIILEIPKYKEHNPDYDSIHFEEGASRIGATLFPNETEKGNITLKEILKNL